MLSWYKNLQIDVGVSLNKCDRVVNGTNVLYSGSCGIGLLKHGRSMSQAREKDYADVVIVGAGPSGLSAAIRIKQLCQRHGSEMRVCLLEKGSEVGAHSISGAVMEPRALNELLPDWKEMDPPVHTPVTKDECYWLTSKRAIPLPVIGAQRNEGNYIISLGEWTRWLSRKAEEMGVEIYPGFPAAELVCDESGSVVGVATGDQGRDKKGDMTDKFERGMELHAPITLLAEGARGSLTKKVISSYDLSEKSEPQTYGLGLKEVWEVSAKNFKQGQVMHTMGWPIDLQTWGGSFVYHHHDNMVSVGYVVALDYKNPYLSPYKEFQRWKQHPKISPLFEGGRCISYGARALNEGGWQSLPRLIFPGGALVGCSAGFLNVPKIKGIHGAIKSGMMAGESAYEVLKESGREGQLMENYAMRVRESWLCQELHRYRNIRPSFGLGAIPGILYTGMDWLFLKGREPWTLPHGRPDNEKTGVASNYKPIVYPKPDGRVNFDLLTNMQRSGTNHNENQPVHLKLKDERIPVQVNYGEYAGLEERYCPGGVYEYPMDAMTGEPRLQINAQNCLHCKTCDIKDPRQNIEWTTPEGGGGPNYMHM